MSDANLSDVNLSEPEAAGGAAGGAVLKILSGVQSGVEVALAAGQYTLGSGADDDIRIIDISLAEGHLALRIAAAGSQVRAAAGQVRSGNGLALEPGSDWAEIEPLDIVMAGTTRFAVAPASAAWTSVTDIAAEPPPAAAEEAPASRLARVAALLERREWRRLALPALALFAVAGIAMWQFASGGAPDAGRDAPGAADPARVRAALAQLPFAGDIGLRQEVDGAIYATGYVETPAERRAVVAAIEALGVPVNMRVWVLQSLRQEIAGLVEAHGRKVTFDISRAGVVTLRGLIPDDAEAERFMALVREGVPGIADVRSDLKTPSSLLAEVEQLAQSARIKPWLLFRLDGALVEATGAIPAEEAGAWADFLQLYARRLAGDIGLRSFVQLQGVNPPADAALGAITIGAAEQRNAGDVAIDVSRLQDGEFAPRELLVGGGAVPAAAGGAAGAASGAVSGTAAGETPAGASAGASGAVPGDPAGGTDVGGFPVSIRAGASSGARMPTTGGSFPASLIPSASEAAVPASPEGAPAATGDGASSGVDPVETPPTRGTVTISAASSRSAGTAVAGGVAGFVPPPPPGREGAVARGTATISAASSMAAGGAAAAGGDTLAPPPGREGDVVSGTASAASSAPGGGAAAGGDTFAPSPGRGGDVVSGTASAASSAPGGGAVAVGGDAFAVPPPPGRQADAVRGTVRVAVPPPQPGTAGPVASAVGMKALAPPPAPRGQADVVAQGTTTFSSPPGAASAVGKDALAVPPPPAGKGEAARGTVTISPASSGAPRAPSAIGMDAFAVPPPWHRGNDATAGTVTIFPSPGALAGAAPVGMDALVMPPSWRRGGYPASAGMAAAPGGSAFAPRASGRAGTRSPASSDGSVDFAFAPRWPGSGGPSWPAASDGSVDFAFAPHLPGGGAPPLSAASGGPVDFGFEPRVSGGGVSPVPAASAMPGDTVAIVPVASGGEASAAAGAPGGASPGSNAQASLVDSTRLLLEQWRDGRLQRGSDANLLMRAIEQLSRESGASEDPSRLARQRMHDRYLPAAGPHGDASEICWPASRLTPQDAVTALFWLDILSVGDTLSLSKFDAANQTALMEVALNPRRAIGCVARAYPDADVTEQSVYLREVQRNPGFVRFVLRDIPPFALDVAGASTTGARRFIQTRAGVKVREGAYPDQASRLLVVGELGAVAETVEGPRVLIYGPELNWLLD